MIKKALFLTILSLFAASSFADNIHHRYLYIEGTAFVEEHYNFFMTTFSLEATSSGYIVTRNRSEAAHTLAFRVSSSSGRDNNQYVVKISLFRNEDAFEITSFEFFFTRIDEVHEYSRTLFQNAVLYIPLYTAEEMNAVQGLYQNWKNKWIYLRASFDYPITFYLLKPDGLKNGGLYNTSTNQFGPQDHKIMAMPGATVGVEFQFLNFMSLELNLELSMGDTRTNLFVNAAAGLELKFPIKFDNIALVPYGVFIYPLNVSTIFTEFPLFALGAGIQLCTRAGRNGAVFLDVKYTFSFSDAVMRNPYLDLPVNQRVFPEPPVIHYNRSVIGIGIGYKYGFFDR